MDNFRFVELGVFVIIFQALALGASEEPICQAGFQTDLLVFKVDRNRLHTGHVLGKVGFSGCSAQKRYVFRCEDSRFRVDTDGTLKVKREVVLHGGHKEFLIHGWDSSGRKSTVPVRVVNSRHHHHNGQERHLAEGHGHHNGISGDHQADVHGRRERQVHHHSNAEVTSSLDLPVLHFPKASTSGLIRKKRAWVIPPINYPENDRGPFPKKMVQIKSDNKDGLTMEYSITGSGADQPPAGLFTCHRLTGQLYVTQPLDREKMSQYKLQAHAVAVGQGLAEEPMDIFVDVIDMNDNKPVFTADPFIGQVPEASAIGYDVVQVNATDADEPGSANSDLRYTLLSQDPPLPSPNMFAINSNTGWIRINDARLDREKYPKYTLEVMAADMEGNGLSVNGKVIITVTDSNDNPPAFVQSTYTSSAPENKVGAPVVQMSVTDSDEPNSAAWAAVFKIVSGDPEGRFAVATGSNKQEGIITTAKELDFEKNNKYTLLVSVENEVPFATRLPTATATVIVNVIDVNEAPVFSPPEKLVVKPEDLAAGSDLVIYTATDPDTARNQKVSYKIQQDLAGWLSVNKDTGVIKVKSMMDRESTFVKNNKYTALISATDNDEIPATGTGTLVIQLEDVNDNGPTIDERVIRVCNKDSTPQLLSVTDKDGPGFAAPYTVELLGQSKSNWTVRLNETKTGIYLTLLTPLEQGDYLVLLRMADNQGLNQDSTIQASVCDCSGPDVTCIDKRAAGIGLPAILGVLGAILLLLMLVLLLMMFLRKRGGEKKEPLLPEDDIRDNIYHYDEEGGGEDDQDYDLSVLHRGLDNRPDVFRNDVMPNFMPAPQYRPRPANPDDIGCFIVDNLKAADNDPTAPPYDSLLVFDYEGAGSEAGSLSSLNSSSSGDQDYDRMNEWGPRFKKLADMYGGGEEDDMM